MRVGSPVRQMADPPPPHLSALRRKRAVRASSRKGSQLSRRLVGALFAVLALTPLALPASVSAQTSPVFQAPEVLSEVLPEADASAQPSPLLAVSAGHYYSCGVRSNGAAVCWGNNFYGQSDAPSGEFASTPAATPQ